MEKKAFRISVLSGILASFLFSLLGCTFEITEKRRIADPDAQNLGNGIVISLKNSNSDTLYVNIFRQDVTNVLNLNNNNNPEINIGVVFPYIKGNETNNTTFVYEDKNVIKGRKYRYCARLYSEADGYTYTNWTSSIKAENGRVSNTSRISYGLPQTTQFIYDKASKTITISGDIVIPTGMDEGEFSENYKPAFVFATDTQKRVFEVESIDDGSIIYLPGLLPADFHDVDIKFLGIIGQKIETYTIPKTKETKIQRIIWTEITSIPAEAFVDKNGEMIPNNKVFLQSEYGQSGFDYASYAFN